MIRSILISSIFFFSLINLYSQSQLSDWKAYTAHSESVKAVVDNDDRLWVITEGGLFVYNPNEESYRVFNNLNGLSSINSTSIYYSNEFDAVFIGYQEGYIDIVDNDFNIINVLDIASSNFTSPNINSIKGFGEVIYIGGSFGLTELLPNLNGGFLDQIFRDTYRNITINDIDIKNDNLWIASNEGVKYLDKSQTISDPDNWSTLDTSNGLFIGDFSLIEVSENQIYLSSETKLYQGSSDLQFSEVHDLEDDNIILSIDIINNEVLLSYRFGYYNYTTSTTKDYYDVITQSIVEFQNQIYYVSNGLGLLQVEDVNNTILPPSPISNVASQMSIDPQSRIWVSTSSRGFMMFDGDIWTNINGNSSDNSEIPTNDYRTIKATRNGEIWTGHFGEGLLRVIEENGNYEFTKYDNSNSPLWGVDPTSGDFVIAAEIEEDDFGNIWIVNWADFFPGPVIHAFDGEKFHEFTYSVDESKRDFFKIAIDPNGTKWMGSFGARSTNGILAFNDNNTLEDTSDDKWMNIKVSSSSKLANNSITALEIDKNGWLWIGTPTGVTYFLTPQFFTFSNSVSDLSPVSPTTFDDLSVNDIMIDPINQKWFATNSGVWVYDSDGVELVDYINSENSPLPTDEVTSLVMDENTGLVYIGTNKGIFSAKSLSIRPLESFDISVYPQPYNPEKHDGLIIDGLAEQSEVKITTLNGELIHSFKTESKKHLWDGITDSGERINQGVYIIYASSETKGIGGVGKFAVTKVK